MIQILVLTDLLLIGLYFSNLPIITLFIFILAHYYTPIEIEVMGIFKEDQGSCKHCHPGKPMELPEFIKHWAVDHDNLLNVISSEVRTHLSLVFPDTNSR